MIKHEEIFLGNSHPVNVMSGKKNFTHVLLIILSSQDCPSSPLTQRDIGSNRYIRRSNSSFHLDGNELKENGESFRWHPTLELKREREIYLKVCRYESVKRGC